MRFYLFNIFNKEMSYGNVTMLGDLPELDDLTGVGNPVRMEPHIMERPNPNDEKFQKYIRPTHQMMVNSGMSQRGGQRENYDHNPIGEISQAEMQAIQQAHYQAQQASVMHSHNCVDIARHIQDCPICSKFHNNDKTAYIIVIIILAIVCLLLLKRVLNV